MPATTDRGRWRPGRAAVASGAIVGVTAGCAHEWLSPRSSWQEPWVIAEWLISAALVGALLGNAVWLGSAPRRRVTRPAAVLAGLSIIAWLAFLWLGEPYVPVRYEGDDPGDVWIVHDAPIPVAGRALGTFGSVNAADRALNLAAGPAVHWAHVAWPVLDRALDDIGRSYAVAGLACVLSTAFWLGAGNTLAAWLRRRRQRRISA